MNDITIFNHLGNDIHVMTDEQGEPLFVLKDICDALEIKNPSMVAGRLDAEDLSQTEVIDNRGILILTERIDTAGKIRPQLLVTPQGQTYFANILS